jgi:hypothetical protein
MYFMRLLSDDTTYESNQLPMTASIKLINETAVAARE